MSDESLTLKECFTSAESLRAKLDAFPSSSSSAFQETLREAVAGYEQCLKIAAQVSLWSPNETLEDVASGDLQYFTVSYYLGDLILKNNVDDRTTVLRRSQDQFTQYLKLLDTYDILSQEDARNLERYGDDPSNFSTVSTRDAAARRNAKIARFREEKALKSKLEHLRSYPTALSNDDATLRALQMTHMALSTHQAFQNLESIAQELQILAMAPPAHPSAPSDGSRNDPRIRNDRENGYSEQLDRPLSELLANGKTGPILSKDGRPLRPFTLLDARQRLRDGVFRPDHNLPTMTIDEYLEEERRRGGIIEGGGEASMRQPEPDEDNLEKAEQETMKQRAWDEFKEDNPRGSGNTMNMG